MEGVDLSLFIKTFAVRPGMQVGKAQLYDVLLGSFKNVISN